MKKNRVEIGTIKKEWGGRTSIAVVYPNTYTVGMSNLAVHLLYARLNADSLVVAERFFLAGENGRSVSEESLRPISDFRAAMFSFSFEADYLNIPKILGKNLPLDRALRSETDTILIAGGPAVTMNPKALAMIFDVIVIGEAEVVLRNITDILKEGSTKAGTLRELSKIKGLLVPSLGNITERVYLKDLNSSPTHSVLWTNDTEFGHMHLVEISRGCPWNCTFCATASIYSPCRFRDKETILKSVEAGLPYRKHIGLIGADILDHPDFETIAKTLIKQNIKISFSSLRASRITKAVAQILADSGHKKATLGIEAGTEALRKQIDKGLSDRAIFNSVHNLANAGITNLKLYFMVGLPNETDEDIMGIANIAKEARKIILRDRKYKTLSPNITIVATPFVPKKSTPLANKPFAEIRYLSNKLKLLRSLIGRIPNTNITGDSPKAAKKEYLLSQGGNELIELIRERNQPC